MAKAKNTETGGLTKKLLAKAKVSPTEVGSKTTTKPKEVSPITFSSLDIFDKCIKRASNLVNFHKENETDTGREEHYCDAYRAAIVLSISALDAFVRTLVIERVKSILVNSNQSLSGGLRDYIKNLLNQDKLLDAARNYNLLETVEKAIREDFEKKSFQGEWKINQFMELVGHSEIFKQVSIKAELNEVTMTNKINKYTKRRHTIAHSGDYKLNQTEQTENDIDKEYAKDCIKVVSVFAKTLNEICLGK